MQLFIIVNDGNNILVDNECLQHYIAISKVMVSSYEGQMAAFL